MKEIAYQFFMPPFPLILLLIVGWLVQQRYVRVGRFLFVSTAIISILLFMPITGKVAIQQLFFSVKPWNLDDPIKPEVVIVPTAGAFKGHDDKWWPSGTSTARIMEGLDIKKKYGLPLIISGGPMPGSQESEAKVLVQFFNLEGTEGIWLEERSRTTYDTAQNIAQLLRPKGKKVVYLMTTGQHLARMAASLRHQGLQVLGRPSIPPIYQYNQWDFVPRNLGLSVWYRALSEYFAIMGYLVTGKISFADFRY